MLSIHFILEKASDFKKLFKVTNMHSQHTERNKQMTITCRKKKLSVLEYFLLHALSVREFQTLSTWSDPP